MSIRSVSCTGVRVARVAFAGVLAAAAQADGAEALQARLDSVVVTGTRTAQRLSETPVRTEVIEAAQLRLTAPRHLADAMELLPGARVETNCQNCGTSEILLLGLEQKYTQLLCDGVPLFSGLAGVYGIEQIPALFIDRIEVVKGGGSSVYGSGAVGGVINLIGRRPARTGGLAEFQIDDVHGNTATTSGAVLDFVTPDGRTAASFYGQRARVAPIDLNGDGFSDLAQRRLDVAGARVTRRTVAGEWRADFTRTREYRRGGNAFDRPDARADISERVDTKREAAVLAWNGTATPDLDLLASAGYARVNRATFYGGLFGRDAEARLDPESAPGLGDNDQPFLDRGYRTVGQVADDQFGFTRNALWNLDAQVNRRWARHQLSAGLQYNREWLEDVVPVSPFVAEYPVRPQAARGDNVGFFVQDQWEVHERWTLVLGLRADRNSELTRAVISPRLNVKWRPGPELALRATFGAGFRAPQAFDEDLHIELIAGDRTRTRQARELAPEKSQSALLSADYTPAFADGRLAVEATAFLTRIRGTFTNSAVRVDPATGESLRWRENGPDAEVGGLEFNVGALPLPALRLDFGWVVQTARYDRPVVLHDSGAGAVVSERHFLETPRHYGVFQAAYRVPAAFDLGLSAVYTGWMRQINQRTGRLNVRTADFITWSFNASRQVLATRAVAVTLSGGIKNLFDARQRDLETGVTRDPYYLYGPRTPRTAYAGVRFEF